MNRDKVPDNTRKEIQSLLNQLSEASWLVRVKAAISLGRLGDPEAVPALITGLSDDHYLVRYHASDALKQIATPQAVEAVKQWEKMEEG